MTMYDPLILLLAAIVGTALGAIFFGGLWWTVHKAATSPRPALLFLSSLLLRTSIVLTGFCWIGLGHWERLVTGLVGFIIARLIVLRLTDVSAENRNSITKEASHAS
jgi:F1F0 ATPase subunit 2